jgi:hypothetical protein
MVIILVLMFDMICISCCDEIWGNGILGFGGLGKTLFQVALRPWPTRVRLWIADLVQKPISTLR